MPAFSTEERHLLNDSLNDYFQDNYGPEHAVKLARAENRDGFGRKDWSNYAELGWLGLMMPESAGGSEGGLTEAGILFAAAGRHLVQEPLVQTLILGAGALQRTGTPEQKALLPEVVKGRLILSFLHSEPGSGYARDHAETVAEKIGADYCLSGSKSFVLGAQSAEQLIVSARLGDQSGPLALFIIPADAAGMHFTSAAGIDGRRGAAVRMDKVKIPASSLLGEGICDRLKDIKVLLDHASLLTCADALGAMVAAADITTEYLLTREQFGRKLSDFQVLQHRIADMRIMCEEVRVIVHAALDAVDSKANDAHLAIWRAKVQTARAARFIGGQGIQLHGGMGMTDEMAIGHYYKRLTMCEAMFGDEVWHLERLAEV